MSLAFLKVNLISDLEFPVQIPEDMVTNYELPIMRKKSNPLRGRHSKIHHMRADAGYKTLKADTEITLIW